MSRSDDPYGRRALFSVPPIDQGETDGQSGIPSIAPASLEGKRALFSGPDPEKIRPIGTEPGSHQDDEPTLLRVHQPRPGGSMWSGASVECRSCGATTRVALTDLPSALFPSIWVPMLRWSRLMRCPSCAEMTWCRIRWSDLLGK